MKFKAFLLSSFVLTACSTDLIENSEPLGTQEDIIMTAKDFEFETPSRTNLEVVDTGAVFTWAANDTVGVFPNKGGQVDFPMVAGAGTKTATFNGGGWALKPKSTYAAYYPYNFYTRTLNKIEVNYQGQTQEHNASTEHLGKYDYMTAMAKTPESGNVKFEFNHLGCLIELSLNLPNKGSLDSLAIISKKEIFINQGYFSLDKPEIRPYSKSNTFSISCKNINTTTDNENVKLYFMLPPIDATSQVADVIFFNNGIKFTGTTQLKKFNAGKIYPLSVTFSETNPNHTYHVEKAGSLSQLINAQDKYNLTELKISGELNGSDIRFIREMAGRNVEGNPTTGKLEYLDIEKSSIVSGGDSYCRIDGKEYFSKKDILGDYMFYQTNLKKIKYPQTCNQIGEYTFNSTQLSDIIIPQNIHTIKSEAFASCRNVNIVKLSNTLKEVKSRAFWGIRADSVWVDFDIRDEVSMAGGPLYQSDINVLTIGNNVKHLGDYAFQGCKISEIEYEPTTQVEYIGEGCFSMDSTIKIMPIPESVKLVKYAAFALTPNLESFKLISGINKNILENYDLIDKYVFIGEYGINGYGSQTILSCPANHPRTYFDDQNMGFGDTAIEKGAFYGNRNLETIHLKYTYYLGDMAFANCESLKSVTTTSLDSIGEQVFSNCSVLEDACIEGDMKSIGNETFSGCSHLKNVTLGSKITHIGNCAFKSCAALQSITIPNTIPPTLGEDVFGDVVDCSNIILYVPSESITSYQSSSEWISYKFNIQGIPQ